MRRTTGIGTGLSALLLLGASVTAGSAPAAAAAPAPTPEPAASAGLLTAMQKDLGLTKSQVQARLAAEKTAVAVEPNAQRAAGSSYGGSWFDAKSGKLTVAVTDGHKAGAVRATGAAVRLVTHSAQQLDAAKKKIDALDAPAGVSSWHVDPKANRVVVNVVASERGDNDVATFVARARQSGPVQIKETTEAPKTFAAGTVGGDPYYTGNVRCSIGFSVYGGFVTAGHCGQPGMGVRGWDGSYIGNFRDRRSPTTTTPGSTSAAAGGPSPWSSAGEPSPTSWSAARARLPSAHRSAAPAPRRTGTAAMSWPRTRPSTTARARSIR